MHPEAVDHLLHRVAGVRRIEQERRKIPSPLSQHPDGFEGGETRGGESEGGERNDRKGERRQDDRRSVVHDSLDDRVQPGDPHTLNRQERDKAKLMDADVRRENVSKSRCQAVGLQLNPVSMMLRTAAQG